MAPDANDPKDLLRGALARDRIHGGYLLSGAGDPPRDAAEWFARALVCSASDPSHRPCGTCPACGKSHAEVVHPALDAKGKSGPCFRHVGEHADLYWLELAPDATRISVTQVRELQRALQFASSEGGRRVAVIDDAEWLNASSQNGLLKLIEEPPPGTTILLVARSASALLPTIRSRCIRVAFPSEAALPLRGEAAPEEVAELAERLDGIERLGLPQLLTWAEDYRGARAVAAANVERLLATGQGWLRERTADRAAEGERDLTPLLDAFRELTHCRRDLTQRNANPQMIAERGLFAIRGALSR
jgi:DNA polymerase-3 subunit delta'